MARTTADVVTLAVFFGATVLHVLYSPYSKIEESFVLSAVHDTLTWGLFDKATVRQYFEYVAFPDPVPHSFVGVQALAFLAYPVALVGRVLGLVRSSADVQTAVRLTLSLINASAVVYFSEVVRQLAITPEDEPQRLEKKLGKRPPHQDGSRARNLFLLLHVVQFNFLFWAGRTIHNSIVLAPVLVALRHVLIADKPWSGSTPSAVVGIAQLVFCTVVLRSEIAGLLIPSWLWLMGTKRAKFGDMLHGALLALAVSIGITTYLDKPLWAGIHGTTELPRLPSPFRELITSNFVPEVEAFVFNVVRGQSADWGIMPRTFYFASALPKALSLTTVLVPIGIALTYSRWASFDDLPAVKKLEITAGLMFIPLFHIGLLSLLAHKELRFIIYTIPCLNAFSGLALGHIFDLTRTDYAAARWLTRLAAAGLLVGSALHALLSAIASHHNYPGGEAMAQVHRAIGTKSTAPVQLHSTVEATMTGSTRFQSLHMARPATGALGVSYLPSVFPRSSVTWEYNRSEDLPSSASAQQQFTHTLSPRSDCSLHGDASKSRQFEPMLPPIRSFSRVSLAAIKAGRVPEIELEDALWVCKRK